MPPGLLLRVISDTAISAHLLKCIPKEACILVSNHTTYLVVCIRHTGATTIAFLPAFCYACAEGILKASTLRCLLCLLRPYTPFTRSNKILLGLYLLDQSSYAQPESTAIACRLPLWLAQNNGATPFAFPPKETIVHLRERLYPYEVSQWLLPVVMLLPSPLECRRLSSTTERGYSCRRSLHGY